MRQVLSLVFFTPILGKRYTRATDCDQFEHFEDTECVANVCVCENGVAVTDCEKHGNDECASCTGAFELQNGHCVPLVCGAGQHIAGDACVANVCVCDNGVLDANNCNEDGAQNCDSCNQFYHAEGQGCEANVCSCNLGTAVTDCPQDGDNVCEACDDGRAPVNGQCLPLICSAEEHVDGGACVANVCSCANGTPVEKCHEDGAALCGACDALFHRAGDACEANVCTCDNGVLTSECTVHEGEQCASCNAGYVLEPGNNGWCMEE